MNIINLIERCHYNVFKLLSQGRNYSEDIHTYYAKEEILYFKTEYAYMLDQGMEQIALQLTAVLCTRSNIVEIRNKF